MFHVCEHFGWCYWENQVKSYFLTYPKIVKVVDFIESLLSGGYSSVHTRLGFETEMLTPKSAEYMKQKGDIIK